MAAPPPRPSAQRAGGPRASLSGAGRSGGSSKEKPQGTFFLGRYRVVEEIGIGGMATVHLARMDGPGGFQKWVAIKRIHPNLVEDDQFVDMFLDEARIAAGINHPNVAQVFDLAKDEGTYWIAMEYLHGEPLREVMRRCEDGKQRMNADVAARMCADAAEGLHAAHELRGKNGQLLGLVHRDVTPHNLFVTYEGYTKVVDFGIAKVADRLSETRAGTLKGKLAYMSPEQVRGQDDVDRTTDIFALGVVLWELTTGHRLFRMDTDLDTLEKVQACIVPPPSTIIQGYPIELESVVMKALAKKKADRFQTAREFSRAMQLYLQRRGVLVGPEEVSVFIRELFADRIEQREAHLAWAADVTSTINIDQLNALKVSRNGGKETSSKTASEASATADHGRPSVPGAASMGMGKGGPPRPAAGMPPAPPTVPGSPAAMGARSSAPGAGLPTFGASPRGLAQTSLLDDDEDIPTTVATRDHIAEMSSPGPRSGPGPMAGPMAGRPSGKPMSAPGQPNAMAGHQGMAHSPFQPPPGSPMATAQQQMGFGQTVAIPPGAAPSFQGPPSLPGASAGPMYAGAASLSGGAPGSLAGFRPPPLSGPPTSSPGPHSSPPLPSFGPPPGSYPGQGHPGQGHPGQGHPGQGHPGQGHPGQGHPGQGYPGQGHPGQGHPGQGHTGQGQPGQGGFGPPSYPQPAQGYGLVPQGGFQAQLPPGAYQTGSGQHMIAARAALRPSQVETALSIPRPDAAQVWMARQAAASRNSHAKNTIVLITVAVLTAIIVVALAALVYYKRKAPAASGSTSAVQLGWQSEDPSGRPDPFVL